MSIRLDPPRGPLPSEETASGCFETMRAYGGKIFRLEPHLDRLWASAQSLGVRRPWSLAQLRGRILRALRTSGIQEATVRIALMTPRDAVVFPSIVVLPAQPPAPALYRRGIHAAIVPTRAVPIGVISAQAKFSARLAGILATAEAQLRGADEAIFMDASGLVTESTASNLGMLKAGVLMTPSCGTGLLAGVTRQVIFEVASALELPVREEPLTRHDLYNADELFLSSTTKECLPVTRVDGRRVGNGKPGRYTQKLQQAFVALVRRELGWSGVASSERARASLGQQQIRRDGRASLRTRHALDRAVVMGGQRVRRRGRGRSRKGMERSNGRGATSAIQLLRQNRA